MAHFFHNDEVEYTLDDYYVMTDFEDDQFPQGSTLRNRNGDSCGSDLEDDFESSQSQSSKTNTTAVEARKGKDIQAIPWDRLSFTRDEYRQNRLKQYKNYESVSFSHQVLDKVCMQVEKANTFYGFQFNTRLVKSTILHFQIEEGTFTFSFKSKMELYPDTAGAIWILYIMLRNLLWATSKHDVYFMHNYSIMHWSSMQKKSTEVLNVAKPIIPTLKNPSSLAQPLSRVQISTMIVKENLLVSGGFHGELICKYLTQKGVAFSTMLTTDNALTNAVDIFADSSGSKRIVTGSNDAQVRVFEVLNFACLNRFHFPWSVNNTSMSPDAKLMAVLGDSVECLVVDAQSGKVVNNLKGHLDYSFSSAWHPNGQILATGNQDMTCRLWDIRKTSESLAILKGRMGAIRAIKFTSDGRFMAMSEPADFVHLFDTESGYEQGQEIDLFGEIAGISFSPDTEALFVGVADSTYGSVMEFTRTRHNRYLQAPF